MSSSAEDAGEPVHDGQKCVISPNMMKFATLTTLLVSDFDIVFTIFACISFMQSGGLFTMFTIVLVFFFFVYVAFCIVAARESYKFVERFMSKVRLNEINGISLEDIEDALEGKRVFWMGPVYETAKKRKGALEALIAAAPEQADAGEISMPLLEQSIKIAEKVGVAELLMPDDLGAGARALFTAHQKLKLARKVQAAGADASLVALLGLPDVEPPPPPEPDFRAKKIYEEEKAVADAAGDDNLSKMLELAYLKHIDSFRVDAKLKDKASGKARDADESSLMPTLPAHVPRDCTFYLSHRGTTLCVLQVLDTGRALYLLCEAKGILAGYYQATRSFSRRIVKPTHSIPCVPATLRVYLWHALLTLIPCVPATLRVYLWHALLTLIPCVPAARRVYIDHMALTLPPSVHHVWQVRAPHVLRLAAVGVAHGFCRHPQRERHLLLHRRVAAAHLLDRLPHRRPRDWPRHQPVRDE